MSGPLSILSVCNLLAVALAAPRASTTTSARSSTSSGSASSSASRPSLSGPPTRSVPLYSTHAPYSGTPTITGALTASSVGTGISVAGIQPGATTYPSDGQLHEPEPAPYVPGGGVGLNTTPVYNVKSDFDYESLALALYQEYIELDLFNYGLAKFKTSDFDAAGLGPEDRYLIEFMAEQEIGHSTMISNILGAEAPLPCSYNYPFETVLEFVDFCQKLTRFGESGVYGFLSHLKSREAAQLLLQAISTEARQQLIFRQFEGLFPMPVWFEVGIPQSWAWTLLAPYISWCPANQTRLAWQNFPALNVSTSGSLQSCLNGTNTTNSCASPAITHNRTTPLSVPGMQVNLTWDSPGKPVGPNNSYVTSTSAGSPAYVAWVTQLNVTYSPLTLSNNSNSSGYTIQPSVETFQGDPAVNGTIFVAITDSNPFLTPFNLSLINPHVVAGPALYQAG